ncbi:MAG: hypothetical protein KDK70_36575, partial [Myxococcales bacterium]|nr:hypothetical protein [Myxococcales bacterium]
MASGPPPPGVSPEPDDAGVEAPPKRGIRAFFARYGRMLWWLHSFYALALANTCTVNQIWVAEGTYYPDQGVGYTPGERTHSFVMKNNLAIYGGFPNTGGPGFGDRDWAANVTILSGDIGSPGDVGDNSYHVVFNNNNGLNSTAKLDGFTISGGNANNNSNGGGM